MTIEEALRWGREILKNAKVEGARASADFLLRKIVGKDKTYLYIHSEEKLTASQEDKYRVWIDRRSKHEPVWYITGEIEFMGLDLAVTTDVLISRPETELLIEKITSEFRESRGVRILDVGTGSGTIVLSLAKLLGVNNSYFASDVSEKALGVARKNAVTNKLDNLVEFRKGDLLSPWNGEKFDLIVANLPYVPHEDMESLALDLIHYEPRLALDGGKAGMEIYEKFLPVLPDYLADSGVVFLEIGYNQGPLITKVVQGTMPKATVEIIGDYADIDRIAIIRT